MFAKLLILVMLLEPWNCQPLDPDLPQTGNRSPKERREEVNKETAMASDNIQRKRPLKPSKKVSKLWTKKFAMMNARIKQLKDAFSLGTDPPAFNCVYELTSRRVKSTDGFWENEAIVSPYTCSPTTAGMDDATGIFTVATAGLYRFTFMSRMHGEDKKVIVHMYKNEEILSIGRADAQVHGAHFDITTTINLMAQLVEGDTIKVVLQLPGADNHGVLPAGVGSGYELIFTGLFIKP